MTANRSVRRGAGGKHISAVMVLFASLLGAGHAPALHAANDEARRVHAWNVVAVVSRDFDPLRISESSSWYRREQIFGEPHSRAQDGADAIGQSSEPEVLIESYYNVLARNHIVDLRLNQVAELNRLLTQGTASTVVRQNRAISPFPAGATVLLAAWWPVAKDGDTALPVWDPDRERPRSAGNNYATWQRIVAITRESISAKRTTRPMSYFGRNYKNVPRVPLSALLHLEINASNAERLMQNPRARKAAVIALGRPLASGDALALVALHIASRDSLDWTWTTLWWHDRADQGKYAGLRPSLSKPWQNYLMDVADPSPSPRGTPAFNPWFEARFPDGGHGGGMASNCIACHQRASYPPVAFLPIRTGPPDLVADPAYASDRLRTDSLWSIARQGLTQ